jgi:hypothetical protein
MTDEEVEVASSNGMQIQAMRCDCAKTLLLTWTAHLALELKLYAFEIIGWSKVRVQSWSPGIQDSLAGTVSATDEEEAAILPRNRCQIWQNAKAERRAKTPTDIVPTWTPLMCLVPT